LIREAREDTKIKKHTTKTAPPFPFAKALKKVEFVMIVELLKLLRAST
jgi:hypothetical protein